MGIGSWIGILIACIVVAIIIGVIIGFKISGKIYKKQMRENPPITEEQIKQMYAQMGRKPSEAQIKQIMNNFKRKIDEKN